MFPSVMEEAIHLPYAPDPNMAGVFSWGRKGLKLGRWSSRADGLRKKKAWGEKDGFLSPYKGSEYRASPPRALKLAYSQGVVRTAQLDYPNLY